MKTIKEIAEITGVTIRTLRYYDEIGLLKPTQYTKAGYRLYDTKALETLQQIMFFRELEIPLLDIKNIIENPNYDKQQVMAAQKALLEKKRNRLNGIIDLISDVMKGENPMNFEVFNEKDIEKMVAHTLEHLSGGYLEAQIKEHGSIEQYRTYLSDGFLKNEQATTDIIKWYGSKEKAVDAVLQSDNDTEKLKQQQQETDEIYKQLMIAKNTKNTDLEKESIEKLASLYKAMFQLDNARSILLDLAKEYFEYENLAEVTNTQYGEGCAKYVAESIQRYYGI